MPASASAVPSPTLTSSTHRRVQEVLRDLVREHQAAIQYSTLLARPSSNVRSRRITIDREQTPILVSVTSDGKTFYRAFGSDPVYEAGDPRLMRLTIPQLNRRAAVFKEVLEDVQRTFLDHYPHNTDAQNLTTLPDAIRDFYNTLSDLEHSNTELQLEMNYEEGRSRRLRHAQDVASPSV
ncbi:hypothetical protein C8T65DRAFT_750044 [Cerioporus squamosus]|nr:hypothetical protein C8T65DRAFT_750044 [Cerioporus squamosus]